MQVTVLGAGVVGAAAAFHAARLGARVTVVDGDHPGRATSAGAGIVCPWTSSVPDADWYALACAGAREYPELVRDLLRVTGVDPGYRVVGALSLTPDARERDRLVERLERRRAEAPELGEVRMTLPGEAQGMFPPLGKKVEGVFVGGAARLDGRLLSEALLRAAALAGATLRSGSAELLRRRDGTVAVRVDGAELPGEVVIAATGAWTAQLLRPIGVSLAVTPQRGQIVHLRVDAGTTGDWPVVLPGPSGHYLLAFPGSRVVVGATRESGAGFDYRVTAAGLREVLTEALAVAPGLASAEHLQTRVGFRPMGPDVRPLLGVLPDVPNLVIATGLGASGLTLGPRVGRLAAGIALGEPGGADLTAFAPGRAVVPDRPGSGGRA